MAAPGRFFVSSQTTAFGKVGRYFPAPESANPDPLSDSNRHWSEFCWVSRIVLRTNRIGAAETREQGLRAPRTHFIRGIFAAASLGVFAVTAYSSIGLLLPQRWQSNVVAVTRGLSPIPYRSGAPAASPPPIPTNVAAQSVAQSMAIVVRDVNVRASPSNAAAVVSTLSRGVKVATIERRGNWTLVQIEGDSRNTKHRQGWVYVYSSNTRCEAKTALAPHRV